MEKAAEFRGGTLISTEMETGDRSTKLDFECAFGRRIKNDSDPGLLNMRMDRQFFLGRNHSFVGIRLVEAIELYSDFFTVYVHSHYV